MIQPHVSASAAPAQLSIRESPGTNDPRSEPDFDGGLCPLADGVAIPGFVADNRDERIKAEFCTVYYRLNRLHAKLCEVRGQPETAARAIEELSLLRDVEYYLRLRDELEDRYTPLGVIAEAVTNEGFTVDIKFTFGDCNILREQRSRLISSTALLFFGEPDDPAAAAEVPGAAVRDQSPA